MRNVDLNPLIFAELMTVLGDHPELTAKQLRELVEAEAGPKLKPGEVLAVLKAVKAGLIDRELTASLFGLELPRKYGRRPGPAQTAQTVGKPGHLTRAEHYVHFVLTVVTCGLWGLVWADAVRRSKPGST